MQTEPYELSDSLAVIRTGTNAIEWAPVYLDLTNTPFIRRYGSWIPVSNVSGFQRYERAKRKKLFDTATLETVEV